MQGHPICLRCTEVVEYDPVYEAPCGHEGCPSAVFHGLCLMEWREWREQYVKEIRDRFRRLFDTHPQEGT